MKSLLFTPESSRFERVALDKAIEMAETVIDCEKKMRIGETGAKQPDGQFAEISPMKYFIFDKVGEVLPLWGEMFGESQDHPKLDSKQQIALLVKIFVNILQSRVVLHVTEAWTADKCHNCGETYSIDVVRDGAPCKCGVDRCQPRDNCYAKEVLFCNIAYFSGHKDEESKMSSFGGYGWVYEILRDDEHKITGFNPIYEKKQGDVAGRMTEHWIIHPHEVPHVLINYPGFCDALGIDCPNRLREAAEMARAVVPKDYPLLSWGLHTDIDEVIEIAKEQHKRTMAEFN